MYSPVLYREISETKSPCPWFPYSYLISCQLSISQPNQTNTKTSENVARRADLMMRFELMKGKAG
jgi:hypothetical protein